MAILRWPVVMRVISEVSTRRRAGGHRNHWSIRYQPHVPAEKQTTGPLARFHDNFHIARRRTLLRN